MGFSGRESEDIASDMVAALGVTQGVGGTFPGKDGPLFTNARVLPTGGTQLITFGDLAAQVYSAANYGLSAAASPTAQTAALQAAFNAVAASGGYLLIPKGNYQIAGTLTMNGASYVTILAPGATITQTLVNTPSINILNSTEIHVQDLHLVGYGINDTAIVTNAGSYGNGAHAFGLWFDTCDRISVTRCRIDKHKNAGVVLWHNSNVLVFGNKITGTRGSGASSADPSFADADGTKQQFALWLVSAYLTDDPAVVKGNNIIIRDNRLGEAIHGAYLGPNYDQVTLDNNRIEWLSQHGVYSVPYKHLSITNNKVANVALNGIKLQGQVTASFANPTSIDVSGNHSDSGAAAAIQCTILDDVSGSSEIRGSTYFDGLTITNNVVSSVGHIGILVATARNAMVAHNHIQSSGFNAIVTYGVDGVVADNTLGSSTGVIGDATHPIIVVNAGSYMTTVVRNNKLQGSNQISVPTNYIQLAYQAGVSDPRAWVASQYFANGTYCQNATNVYICRQSGVTAPSGGPTTTGTGIVDGGCIWDFVVAVASVSQGTIILERNKVMIPSVEPTNSILMSGSNIKFRSNDLEGTVRLIAFSATPLTIEDDGKNIHGGWAPGGPYNNSNLLPGMPRREIYSNVIPASGTWQLGDKCWNTAPTAGGVLMWICTTGGTPGTWKPVSIGP